MMGALLQVFPEISFQGRLRTADEWYKAEILFFIEQLEEHGDAVFFVKRYCEVEEEEYDTDGRLAWLTILINLRSAWTRFFLEVRQPGVLVMYDRRQVQT